MEKTFSKSRNWGIWISEEDIQRCEECERLHGKVIYMHPKPAPSPPLHPACRCRIEIMKALRAGTATDLGVKGADWYLKYYNKLPEYYITIERAKQLGWKRKKGNLADVAPGCMITQVYYNNDKRLPNKLGRVWYEADIDYKIGKRNSGRIVFSNDGLIFVTYDHYTTFVEIR